MRRTLGLLLLMQCLVASAFNDRISIKERHDAIGVEEADSIHLYRIAGKIFTLTIDLKGIENKDSVSVLLNETSITDTTLTADSVVSYTLNSETLYDIKGLEYPCCVYGSNYKPITTIASNFAPKSQIIEKAYQQSELPYTYRKDTAKLYTPAPSDTALYVKYMGRSFPQLSKEDIAKRGIDNTAENAYKIDSLKEYYRDSVLLSHIRIFDTKINEDWDSWRITGVCYLFPNGTADSTVVIRTAPAIKVGGESLFDCEDNSVQLCPLPIQTYRNKEGKNRPIERNVEITYYVYDHKSQKNTEEKLSDKNTIFDLPLSNAKTQYVFSETVLGETVKFASDSLSIGLSINPTMTLEAKIEHNREGDHDTQEIEFVGEGEDVMLQEALSTPFKVEMYGNPSPTAGNYEWHFASNERFSGSRVVYAQDRISIQIEYNQAMKQYIMFKATNLTSKCTASAMIGMNLAQPELYVPNIFTPEIDGTPDEFRVSYVSIKKFHIVIFNTFGKKVYESEDITKGWDGTYKGSKVANGAYYYVISAIDAEGKEISKKGTVNVFRKVK